MLVLLALFRVNLLAFHAIISSFFLGGVGGGDLMYMDLV